MILMGRGYHYPNDRDVSSLKAKRSIQCII